MVGSMSETSRHRRKHLAIRLRRKHLAAHHHHHRRRKHLVIALPVAIVVCVAVGVPIVLSMAPSVSSPVHASTTSSVASTTSSVASTTSPPSAPAASSLGVYAGYENVSGVVEFSQLVHVPSAQAMDFFDGTSWNTIEESPSNIVPAWEGTPYRMTWSIPILPSDGSTLAQGAAGLFDHHFAVIAQYLVAQNQGQSVIRLGWEFNGGWFPWSAGKCATCFVSYWQQIVTTMRAVPGAQFRFEWNPNIGAIQLPPPRAYPGNDFVDIIGSDVYDNELGEHTPSERWNQLYSEPYGLKWLVDFAKAHSKPISLPEWGLGFAPAGGGDDPYFIKQMALFIGSQPDVDNALYWESGSSVLTRWPLSRAAYTRYFGAS